MNEQQLNLHSPHNTPITNNSAPNAVGIPRFRKKGQLECCAG